MPRTALYRLFNEDGVLLYVGITDNPATRWPGHKASKSWWPDVAVKEIEWLDDRRTAEDAERQAIRTESPLYNVRDVPGLTQSRTRRDPDKDVTAFWRYAMRVSGGHSPSEIARTLGLKVAVSTVARWRDATPRIDSVLAFARAYKVSPVSAFVAAGFLTSEEADMPRDLTTVSHDDFCGELARRLGLTLDDIKPKQEPDAA